MKSNSQRDAIYEDQYHKLNFLCSIFIDLKALEQTHKNIYEVIGDREYRDAIAAQLLLNSSADGLILAITNFNEEFIRYLSKVMADGPEIFSTRVLRKFENNNRKSSSLFLTTKKTAYVEARKRLFPQSEGWKNGKPSNEEVTKLQEQLRVICYPIVTYRNKTVAHKDIDAFQIKRSSIGQYFEVFELILRDIIQLTCLSSPTLQRMGDKSTPLNTAKKFVSICLVD